MRIFLTICLVAPAALIFLELRDYIDTRQSTATRELLGVEYLRALEPLAVALDTAQAAAVAGAAAPVRGSDSALRSAVAGVAAVDQRAGSALGTSERWRDLRTRIEALPQQSDPRTVYTAHHDVAGLLAVLTDRVGQRSGLSTDAEVGTNFLHRAVSGDLPRVTLQIGRFADLMKVNRGRSPDAPELADLLELQRSASRAGADLVDSMEAAADDTTNSALTTSIYTQLNEVRTVLDQFASAAGLLADGYVSTADVEVVGTQRTHLSRAASILSEIAFDQLDRLLTERRDAAGRERTLAVAGLVVLVSLALAPTAFGVRDVYVRRRESRVRSDLDEPPIGSGPEWARHSAVQANAARGNATPRRERAGAAR
jgi:hypothetical protein